MEMDSNSALVPAPIPHRLMVGLNVQDLAQKQGHVTMAHALVSDYMVTYKTKLILAEKS